MHLSSVGRADAFSFSHSLHFFPSALSGFLFAPQPYAVLFSVWAVPSQPYSRHEKRRCRSCATAAPCGPFGAQPSASGNLIASRQAHFSTITRLPSGSPVSRSVSFRSGAFGLRSRYCPPLHEALCRFGSRAAPASWCIFAVRCALISRMRTAWLGVEYHSQRQSAHLREPVRTPSNLNHSASCRASPCSVALYVVNLRLIVAALSRLSAVQGTAWGDDR